MGVNNLEDRSMATRSAKIKIWDTEYAPPGRAFGIYRDAVSKDYMPWSHKFRADCEFQARVETLTIGQGSISKIRCSPHIAFRTLADIANSEAECLFVTLFLSGQQEAEQDGRNNTVNPGDVLVCDSAEPLKVTMSPAPQDFVVLTVPKAQLSTVGDANAHLTNRVLAHKSTPLAMCMALIGERMVAGSKEELISLYHACLFLLPLAAGLYGSDEDVALTDPTAHYLLRQILSYVDANSDTVDLSPQHIAIKFGISVRYVHKLFKTSGTTFGSHVTATRLDHVRSDLISPSGQKRRIAVVAYRWGFNDLSTFARTFKKRFGCTPSGFQSRR